MKTATLLILIFVSSLLQAQTFAWADQMGGPLEDISNSIATDVNGNVYTCGRFNGTADFDPGANTYNLTAGSLGAMFVSKLNAAGDFVWARQIDGNPGGLNLAAGVHGSVYITGHFSGVVDFDLDAGVYNLTSTPNPNESCGPSIDIFILKLSSAGDFMWAGQIGGFGDDVAGSAYHKAGGGIALGANDALYVGGGVGKPQGSGWYTHNWVDFDPSLGGTYYDTIIIPAAFVVKLDSSGVFDWVATWEFDYESLSCSHISSATCHSIALDINGNVYYTGKKGGFQAFVRKISSSGTSLWTATLSGGLSVGYDVAVDASGSVYTTGYFAGTSDFDPSTNKKELKSQGSSGGPNPVPDWGLADAFVWKLSSSGAYQWACQFGGDGLSVGRSIDLDASGYVYTTGYFTGTNVDFNPHKTQKYLLNATGGEDVYVSKLTSAGIFVWAVKLGGTLNDKGYGVDVDAAGNVISTGTFEGNVDFNPAAGTYNMTSYGGADIFIQKMTQAGGPALNAPVVVRSISIPEFTVYPNPAQECVVISFSADKESSYEIMLIDMSGKLIQRHEGKSLIGSNAYDLKFGTIPQGIYQILFSLGDTRVVKLLVVE